MVCGAEFELPLFFEDAMRYNEIKDNIQKEERPMDQREEIIRLWFDMWLRQEDLGMDDIFTEDVVYTGNWGPKYEDRATVKHWFQEWNTRGKVLAWDIKQFFHKGDQTVVEWYFENKMQAGAVEAFDGVSLVL